MSGEPRPKAPKPAKARGYRGTPQLRKARKDVESRANSRCEARTHVCEGRGTQAHHMLRKSQGGPDELWNLLWVCSPCHTYIHGHVAESFERGWLTRRSA